MLDVNDVDYHFVKQNAGIRNQNDKKCLIKFIEFNSNDKTKVSSENVNQIWQFNQNIIGITKGYSTVQNVEKKSCENVLPLAVCIFFTKSNLNYKYAMEKQMQACVILCVALVFYAA